MVSTVSIPDHLYLLNHPFYQAWVAGRLPKVALQDYVGQYYHHVDAFPGYLQNTIDICTEPAAAEILKENLAEEDGSAFGTSHPELWLRFSEGVGVAREDVKSAILRQGITNVTQTFNNFSRASLAEALGSLYAYESQVPEIAGSKIEGLKRHFDIRDERTLSFFEIHKSADIEHRRHLLKVIESLKLEEQNQARRAARVSAQALWDFLTDVCDHNGIACV